MLEVGDLITDTSTQEANGLASRLCKSITFKGYEIMFHFYPYVFSDTISQSAKLLMIYAGLNYLSILFKGVSRVHLFRQLRWWCGIKFFLLESFLISVSHLYLFAC